MSAIYIWNPYILPNESNRMGIVLTNGDITDGVPQDRNFIESVLKEIGVEVKLKDWSINPYRSKYYSEYIGEDDWRDTWQVVWKIDIFGVDEITFSPNMETSWIGINVSGENWKYVPDDDDIINCLIVSDFDTYEMLNNAKAAISEDVSLNEIRHKYSFDKLVFYDAELFNNYKQLQIDIGRFSRDFFASGAIYAEQVIELCQQGGGTIHFEARE